MGSKMWEDLFFLFRRETDWISSLSFSGTGDFLYQGFGGFLVFRLETFAVAAPWGVENWGG